MSGSSRPAESFVAATQWPAYWRLSVWLRTHIVVVSVIVLCLSLAVRLSMAVRADPVDSMRLYPDAATYVTPAISLVTHRAFLDSRGEPSFHRTPGYPGFLAGIMWLTAGRLRAALIVQTLLLSLGPLLLYWLARRTMPSVMALIGGIVAALSPWGSALAGIPISDGLFLMLLIVIFLLINITMHSRLSGALLLAVCIGGLTGAAVLVRPISPLVVLVPAGLAFCAGLRHARAWVLLAVCLGCAVIPPALWIQRNRHTAHFDGLSDITGQTAWEYLAARVRADMTGENRHAVSDVAAREETTWGVPLWTQELDNERWRRANAIFRQHPFRTAYAFGCDLLEQVIHPSPDVLQASRMSFRGDVVVLALWWGALLLASILALWQPHRFTELDDRPVDWRTLMMMLAICGALTFSSGISYGGGSRLRAPLEAIVPLLTAVGLVHTLCRVSPRFVTRRPAPR